MTRRDVIVGATWIVAAPAIHLLLPEKPATFASQRRIVFMIHGWSAQDDCGAAQVWMTVGNSWRAAWR